MERNVSVKKKKKAYDLIKTNKNIWSQNPLNQYHVENYPKKKRILPLKKYQC